MKLIQTFTDYGALLTSSLTISSTYPYYKSNIDYTTQVYVYEATSYLMYPIFKFLAIKYVENEVKEVKNDDDH